MERMFSTVTREAPMESGWQTTFFRSHFDWHESDPNLLWRFKPNLNNRLIKTNSRGFIGDEVVTDKPDNTYRILLLGDSSPVGLGLSSRAATFAEILKRRLSMKTPPEVRIEMINAAVSGYTSEQIVRFMNLEGWDYEPDLVLLYCGNNDASISGYFSDRTLLDRQSLRGLRRTLNHLATYRTLRSVIQSIRPRSKTTDSELVVRVSPEEFGENLGRLADGCRQHDCELIILKPPVPLLWPAGLQFKTFAHTTGDDGELILPPEMIRILGRELKYCLDTTLFRTLYSDGDLFTKAVYASAFNDGLDPSDAVDYWTHRIRTESPAPLYLNNLGVSRWRMEQYDVADSVLHSARDVYLSEHSGDISKAVAAAGSAILFNIGINAISEGQTPSLPHKDTSLPWIYLDSALQADFFSLRIKRDYTQMIDAMSDDDVVTVIDLPGLFTANGGEKLFIDHCHPTPQGHLLIAEELLPVIEARIK